MKVFDDRNETDPDHTILAAVIACALALPSHVGVEGGGIADEWAEDAVVRDCLRETRLAHPTRKTTEERSEGPGGASRIMSTRATVQTAERRPKASKRASGYY